MKTPHFSIGKATSAKMRRDAVLGLAGRVTSSGREPPTRTRSSLASDLQFTCDLLEDLPSVPRLGAARRVLARMLPVRHGLWWACLCIDDAIGESSTPDQRDAVSSVARYVVHPTKENRQRMGGSRQTASPIRIAGLLGCQALDDIESDRTVDSPKRDAAAKLIASTICQAAFWRAADDYQLQLFRYVELGLRVGLGQLPWPGMGRLGDDSLQREIYRISEHVGLGTLPIPSEIESPTEGEVYLDQPAGPPAPKAPISAGDVVSEPYSL